MSRHREQTGHSLSARKAQRDDTDWLVQLRIATMSEYLTASGEHLTMRDHRARVLQDFNCISIIELNGKRVGMMKVVKYPSYQELVQIQFSPSHQNQGLGTRLLKQMIDAAERADKAIALSVLKVNPAKRLYERLGFEVIEEGTHSYRMHFRRTDS